MKKTILWILLIVTMLLRNGYVYGLNLLGGNIIGGDISYTQLDSGNYKITLTLYTNCVSETAVSETAKVSIYDYSFESVIIVELELIDISLIPVVPYDTCNFINELPCLDKIIYQGNIDLSNYSGTKFITYERCCRIEDLDNLHSYPQGLGIIVETPDFAEVEQNSSPYQLIDSIPIYCINDTIKIDAKFVDVDNDSLVFSFANPLIGGSEYDHLPLPSDPPPYDNILYHFGHFYDDPINASVPFTIDPISGIIKGVASESGKFLIGIKVEEYRDGILLKTYQFEKFVYISDCENEITSQTDSLYIGCNEKEIQFTNLSEGATNYFWNFGDGSTSEDYAPLHLYNEIGTYIASLITNPATFCSDTSYSTVVIHEPLFNVLHIIVSGDHELCFGDSVILTSTSPYFNVWNTGDTTQMITVKNKQYEDDELFYYVTANNYCENFSENEPVLYLKSPNKEIIYEDGILTSLNSWSTFQWYVDETLITGAIEKTYFPATPGAYYVFITSDTNYCSIWSDTIYLAVLPVTSQEGMSEIKIFPNPAGYDFTISSIYNLTDCVVEILSYQGALLEKREYKNFVSDRFTIDDQGIYIIKVIANKHSLIRKVVITGKP